MLTLKQLLRWSKDPARLRAEAAALRERERAEAERRASEGPSDEEFRSWTPEEQAAYLEQVASEAEQAEHERAQAERRAELEPVIADLESTIQADAASGAVLLVQLTELLTDQRARARRLHGLQRELEQAGGPPAPPLKVPSLESYGESFEASGEGLEGDAAEVHRDVLRLIDPDGVEHRAGIRYRKRLALQREHQTALDTIERLEPELADLRKAKLITCPPRDGMEGGTYLTLGDRRWFDIRTDRQHRERIARVEETIAKAKETAARTEHAAVQSTLTPSTPQDTGDLSVDVGGPRLFQAKL